MRFWNRSRGGLPDAAGWTIRDARTGEARHLTKLAMRSKAVWGYDAAFMERCRPLLTVTPAYISAHACFVGEDSRGVGGFCALAPRGAGIQLDLLFIEPARIGEGLGSLLFERAATEASERGYPTLLVESDPGAEAFYLRMGALRIGSVPSTVLPDRHLPLLAYPLVPVSGHSEERRVSAR